MKVDENAMQTYFDEHNPFCFKDSRGKLCYFETYREAYLDLLERLRLAFHEGYIDSVLFLHDQYGLKDADAEFEVTRWKNRGHQEPVLVEWNDPLYIMELRELCQYLHSFTETSFKEDLFKLAYLDFSNKLKNGDYGKVTRKDE